MSATLSQILVHLDDSPAAKARLQFARRIATRHDAALTGLYAVTPALIDVPFAAEAGAAAIAALREIDDERTKQARLAFDNCIDEGGGVRAQWAQVSGFPVTSTFATEALFADLVVLGQPDPQHAVAGTPPDFLEGVIIESGKPALVVPYAGECKADAETIAIAWKPTRESARAVAAAMPLLCKARQVHVMSWGDDEELGVTGSRLTLDGWLQRHGVRATWHRDASSEPDFIGEAILSRVFDLNADLLVMGCYGHSRAREWVLGGASHTVLRSMTVPVLMAH